MSGPPDVPPPPGAASPPPVPSSSGRGPLFWILVSCGALFVLCCAGGLVVWLVVRDKFEEFANLPPEERERRMNELAASMGADELRAADEFVRAVDEERDDDAWEMTTPAFRISMPRDKFGEMTELVGNVVGRCNSKLVRTFNSRSKIGGGSSCSLVFAAKFEKGDGTISFDLVEVNGAWKVQAWKVESPLFLDAMKRGSGK